MFVYFFIYFQKHNKCSLIISQFYLSISGIFWLVAVVMLVLIRFSSEYPDPVAGQFTDLCGNDKLTQAYDLQDQWRIHSALAILFTANVSLIEVQFLILVVRKYLSNLTNFYGRL